MKIICNTGELLSACTKVIRSVPNKPYMPHLEGVLIKTCPDGTVSLSGYDLEMGITTSCKAEIAEEGSAVFSAKKLSEMLRLAADENTTIETDERFVTTLSNGSSVSRIAGFNPEEYPEIPSVAEGCDEFGIRKVVLREMIRNTIFAVTLNDPKSVHRGIRVELTPGEITMIALDGFRLSVRREFIDYNGENVSFVVPSKTMGEIMKFIDDEDEFITLRKGRKHIEFSVDGCTVISKLLEGDFLNYRSAIPQSKQTVVRVDTKRLMQAIERASVMITEKTKTPMKFVFDDDEIKISAITPFGSSSDRISASMEGKKTEIGFNNRFVLDALRACEYEECLFILNGPLSPALITPVEGDNFTYLVCAVKIKND